MPPNPVVAFGASEKSFYVGCGLKYYAPGVPMSLTTTIQTMPAMDMAWLSYVPLSHLRASCLVDVLNPTADLTERRKLGSLVRKIAIEVRLIHN